MSDDHSFVLAIQANPNDSALRLVYADWLEERGDPRAEYLRLETRLAGLAKEKQEHEAVRRRLAELTPLISPDWLARLSRSKIELCTVVFAFQCPKQWDRLRRTEDSAVRYCDACQKIVHYCATLDEAIEHALMNHCVAVEPALARNPGDLDVWRTELMMGAIDVSSRRTAVRTRKVTRTASRGEPAA